MKRVKRQAKAGMRQICPRRKSRWPGTPTTPPPGTISVANERKNRAGYEENLEEMRMDEIPAKETPNDRRVRAGDEEKN